MKRVTLAFALWLILPALLLAQTLTPMPSEGKLLGGVKSDVAGKWIVIAEGMKFIQPTVIDEGKSILFEGDPGLYGVIFFPPGDAQPQTTTVILKGGDRPDPPLPPDPTPGGLKQIVMFYDGNQKDNLPNEQRQLMFSLATIKKIEKLGHSVLEIVESKALGRSDLPKRIESFAAAAEDLGQFPSIVVAPLTGGKLEAYPLPKNYDELIKLLGEQ